MSGSTTVAPGSVVGERRELGDRLLGGGRHLARRDHQPHRLDLERASEAEDVDQVAGLEDGHLDAAVGLAAKQALGDQDLGRGAKRVPGDPEPLGELGLAQPGAGLESPVEDQLAKGVGGGLDGGDGGQVQVRGVGFGGRGGSLGGAFSLDHVSHHSTI